MNIEKFTELYRICPICRRPTELHVDAYSTSGILDPSIHAEIVRQNQFEIVVNVYSNYFLIPGKKEIMFTVSIDQNGFINHCNMANEFGAMYDININLKRNCNHNPLFSEHYNHDVYTSITVKYDRCDSRFSMFDYTEGFSISNGQEQHSIVNEPNNIENSKVMILKSGKISSYTIPRLDIGSLLING